MPSMKEARSYRQKHVPWKTTVTLRHSDIQMFLIYMCDTMRFHDFSVVLDVPCLFVCLSVLK